MKLCMGAKSLSRHFDAAENEFRAAGSYLALLLTTRVLQFLVVLMSTQTGALGERHLGNASHD